MYDHILHHGKNFCRYYLQACVIEAILKCHMKECFKINGKKKKRIIMPKKANKLNPKIIK